MTYNTLCIEGQIVKLKKHGYEKVMELHTGTEVYVLEEEN